MPPTAPRSVEIVPSVLPADFAHLGDAVIELVVTEFLYRGYPNPEGELTNWRASLVNAKTLSEIASEIGMEQYLYLSRGESKDAGSKARQFILANAIVAPFADESESSRRYQPGSGRAPASSGA